MLSMGFDRSDAKSKLASLAFNATDGNNVILVWTREHQIDGYHMERHRDVFLLARMLSPVRYIQPLAN